ncbi:MAG: peptidoglycan DD-metalloendopeptidase family protein [Kofleriaceae bacterium]
MQASPFAAPPQQADPAHTAGKQLEAFFLRQLLAEARPQAGGDDGFAGDTFKQMFDEAVADKMSGAGGIGLADIFAKQLSVKAGGSAGGSAGEVANGTPIANALPQHTTVGVPALPTGPDLDGIPRMTMPVVGRPSSGYGSRIDPIQHKEIKHPGFDLAARTGTPVGAAAAGTVVHAGPAGTYGNLVTIRHGNGVETRYAHLSATTVHVGDHVDAGQQVGNVGTTGYSTGPHLHFEIRKDGQAIDPAPFLPINTHPGRPKP